MTGEKNAYDIRVTWHSKRGVLSEMDEIATLLLWGCREMQPAALRFSAEREKGEKI